jgi:Metalloenzyme superfamily
VLNRAKCKLLASVIRYGVGGEWSGLGRLSTSSIACGRSVGVAFRGRSRSVCLGKIQLQLLRRRPWAPKVLSVYLQEPLCTNLLGLCLPPGAAADRRRGGQSFLGSLYLQELLRAVDEVGGRFLLTADHGNAEDMVQHRKGSRDPIRDKSGRPVPLSSHTLWPVRGA